MRKALWKIGHEETEENRGKTTSLRQADRGFKRFDEVDA